MAEFFLDHGAYGLASNRIGLDAPATWGVPQEGDGYSKDPATASAVAEIQIIASPTASETLVIAGATITAGASAAANVFVRGANPAATATNIVALINSANFTATVSTNVVNSTGIASTANQGRNLFYAQVKSGATDTVQIMWRIGSAALNHAANSNVAITSASWASAPTITQFAGGISGCWGWLISPAALGQGSSLAAYTYGVLLSRPTIVRSGAGSTIGAMAITDPIWLRSGAGQTVTCSLGGDITRNVNAGSYWLICDSNTKWTGDSGTGVFDLRFTNTSTYPLLVKLMAVNGATARLSSLVLGNFKITGYTTGVSTTNLCTSPVTNSYELIFDKLILEEDATSTGTGGFNAFPNGAGNVIAACIARGCVFNFLRAFSTARTLAILGNTTYNRRTLAEDCAFNFNYTGVVQPTVGVFGVQAGTAPLRAAIRRCRFTGLGAYTQPVFSMSGGSWSGNALVDLVAEDVAGSDVGTNGLAPWKYLTGDSECVRRVFVSNPDAGGSWRLEQTNGASDWIQGAGFPTLAALSPGGAIAHSMRVFWLPTPTGQHPAFGYTAPQMRQQSRASTGTRTLTLELFLPTAITYTGFNFSVSFSYVDNTGVLRTEVKSGADLVASGASWTNAGSFGTHAAKKITFTTANQVKQYTDVTVDVTLLGDCPTGFLEYLFVDPALVIA